ncbi:MAG TPA: type I-C CRISPR-associated protein Cas8c/Csd1 [Smithellaceae bacterium]|nr:type I-C CRISPR-associated protein Cas8c/Csd1 [Smithellaceae bacterium]
MILQALKGYYDRKAELPREGWEIKEIPFLVLLNQDGDFVGFEDTREGAGKKRRAKKFLVPSLGEKKGNGIKSNLLWENIEYMFNIPVPTESKKAPDIARVQKQHQEFIHCIAAIGGDCETLKIVRRFLDKAFSEVVKNDRLWSEVFKLNQSLLLSIIDRGPVTNDPELRRMIDASRPLSGNKGRCLVTGREDTITALEPPVKGVRGANSSGASLVSVNNKITNGTNGGAVPAFASFMKEQGNNSPIGKTASFAYTTALNHLLGKESQQKLQVADATTIFWSEKVTSLENDVFFFFSDPPKDDPDRNTEAVKTLYDSIWNGSYIVPDDSTRFYVLGLSPNSARIAVRFWHVGTVQGIGDRLKQHVEDLSIVHSTKTDSALPMRRLLRSIAAQEKDDNIPPNIAGETMRAILDGTPYPATFIQAVLRRIRAEQAKKNKKSGKPEPNVSYERAAIIKACLNRALRFNNPGDEKEITMSLDRENTNIGYRLGRLFATLEKIQSDANPGINATIRDRFYGAASSTPVIAFATLMRLKEHHLTKLKKEKHSLFIFHERLIGEIMLPITSFPTHLDMADQGRFAIGYYHQTHDLWNKKPEKP